MYRNFGIKEERLVFFGDVLGFKDMIIQSEQQRINSMLTANINDFLGAVKFYLETYHQNIKVTIISDSIIISASECYADEFFEVVAHIYCDYYGLDFILRGAITYGKIYHEENIFGSGYIEAYRLESKKAKKPRIIVDEKALHYVKTNYLINEKDYRCFDAFRYYLDNNCGGDISVIANCWLKTIERYIGMAHSKVEETKSHKRKMLSGLKWLLKILKSVVKQINFDKFNKYSKEIINSKIIELRKKCEIEE